jgi:hypothetical protein
MNNIINAIGNNANKTAPVVKTSKRAYMYVNVILTFSNCNSYGDTQEFFDLNIPVSKNEIDTFDFLDKKLFKRIVKKCEYFGRNVKQLIKISTASNWAVFEQTTNKTSLSDLGHSCKWYFGTNRNDLDEWEMDLMAEYGFGVDVDLEVYLRTFGHQH